MIEEQARKQIKEQETRKQAALLTNFLSFSDIEDFSRVECTKSFKQVDFEEPREEKKGVDGF